jgi:hypothetical protein
VTTDIMLPTPATDDEVGEILTKAMSATANEALRVGSLVARIRQEQGRRNDAYAERNQVVIGFARACLALGLPVFMAKHDPADTSWEDDWRNLIVIELPTGQITWHFHDSEAHLWADLPTGEHQWDGHDTPEKYRRVNTWRP